MARQPLGKIIPLSKRPTVYFGAHWTSARPREMAIVGHIIATWSYVEAEMAIVLGYLLKAEANNAAVLAVFRVIRQAGKEAEAMIAASNAHLEPREQELMQALLDLNRSFGKERNALAHGCLGVCTEIEDGLAYLPDDDQVAAKVKEFAKPPEDRDAGYLELLPKVEIYRGRDLHALYVRVTVLWVTWQRFLFHLQQPDEARYQALCLEPQLAQAIAVVRQKNALEGLPRWSASNMGG